jgi:dihydrofolate synthase/folylpolyglutamate synthase
MATVSPTTYDAALAFLYGRINYERTLPTYRSQVFKLDRMRELLRRLGDPQTGLPIVHVAGTKGKGSTSSMLAAILGAAGYRTGLYTSPHLERTEERLCVDGVPCSPEAFVELVALLRPIVERIDEESDQDQGPGSPTFFEIMTAMSLLHFARSKVDAVVLEVGLGGRLDSTNVCEPAVTVITSISFDHMKQLGNTLAAIAGEKAGIIKPGIPIVTGVTSTEPLAVIERVAAEQGAPLCKVGVDFHCTVGTQLEAAPASRLPHAVLDYHGHIHHQPTHYRDLTVGLIGKHQAANAAVAIAVTERLCEQGWRIDEAALRKGLASVRCPARVEVLQTEPLVLVDTAHNLASIAALVEVLRETRTAGRRHLLFACSKDKDAPGMLAQLWPQFDQVVVTRFLNNPRSHGPEELAAFAAQTCGPSALDPERLRQFPDPLSAWEFISSQASRDDLVCITGSFFLAAELRGVVLQHPDE